MGAMDGVVGGEDFQHATQRFEEWLQSAGVVVSSSIKLTDLREQSAGRAVTATRDIEEDEELFRIPRAAILTPQTSALPENLRQSIDDPWLSLILAMVYEHQRGEASKWKPYFDVLPTEFDTLMYWTDEELKYLEGSAVVHKIGRKSADKAFTEQILLIIKQHSEHFPGLDLSDESVLALCHRMGSIIMAYAFDLERTSSTEEQDGWEEDSDAGSQVLPKGMVPLADMLNADGDRNNAKLFYEDDHVVMKTIKAVKAGEELFNDYGPLPSADVLRRYGYVTANYAEYDVVEISLDLIKTEAQTQLKMKEKDITTRTDYLEEQGILDDSYDISRASSQEGKFSDELCALLNLLVLPQADFEKMRKKEKLPKPELSKEGARLLYTVLVKRRSQYPPNVAPQSDRSQDGCRRQMACQVIDGEKVVLQEAAETLHKLLQEGNKRKADTLVEEAEALRTASKKDIKMG